MYEEKTDKMSVIGHLEELRKRIIACIIFFLVMSIIAFIFIDKLVYILKLPAMDSIENFIFLTPTEAFVSYIRVAILFGFIASILFIIIQAGLFFKPAMPINRRKPILIWLAASFLLSLLGILFSYFLAIPFALRFLMNFGSNVAKPMISIGRYLSFVGALILIGAGIFQIPIIIGFLSEIGILNTMFLQRQRKYAIIIILVIAAIITPTHDIINMLIFALPMWLLYEIGILTSWIIEKRRGY